MFDVVWVGDVLLADRSQSCLDRHGYEWPFEHLRPLLATDYLVGNAEGPITTRTQLHWPDRPYNYNADPVAAAALARVGFDAMSLANNHALDRGTEGLADTVAHLRTAGVRSFGAGVDLAAAQAPLLIDTPFGAVGVVGIGNAFRHGQAAALGIPGTLVITPETIARGRELALAAGARWVVGYVHWGGTYRPVTDKQRRDAGWFARAGYDLVIGHGSHTAQPAETVHGMPVLYSIGNCAFGSFGRFAKRGVPGHGLVVRTRFAGHGLAGIELTPIVTDNKVVHFQPRRCDPATTAEVFAGLGSAVTHAGLVPQPPDVDR